MLEALKHLKGKKTLEALGSAVAENLPSIITPISFIYNVATSMAIYAATEMTDHNLGLARNKSASLAIDALPILPEQKNYIGSNFNSVTHDKNRLTEPSQTDFEETHHSIIRGASTLATNTIPGNTWLTDDASEQLVRFFNINKEKYDIYAQKDTGLWGHTEYTVSTSKDGGQIGERWIAQVTTHAPLIHELLTAFAFNQQPSPRQEFRISTPGLSINHSNNDGTELTLKPRSDKARHNLLDDIQKKKIGTLGIQEAIANLTQLDIFESAVVTSTTDVNQKVQHSLSLTLPLGQLENSFPLPISASIIISDNGNTCDSIAKLTGNALFGDKEQISEYLKKRLEELGINAKIMQS